jgi:hypothetical protein
VWCRGMVDIMPTNRRLIATTVLFLLAALRIGR